MCHEVKRLSPISNYTSYSIEHFIYKYESNIFLYFYLTVPYYIIIQTNNRHHYFLPPPRYKPFFHTPSRSELSVFSEDTKRLVSACNDHKGETNAYANLCTVASRQNTPVLYADAEIAVVFHFFTLETFREIRSFR